MTAVTAVLARYPEQVITSVTHPVTGLPSKKSWLPTIKEVRDACEEVMEPIVQNEARLKRIKEQVEARAREDAGVKPTMEQLKERFGETWGLAPELPPRKKEFKALSWQEIASMYSADPSMMKRLVNTDASYARGETEGQK